MAMRAGNSPRCRASLEFRFPTPWNLRMPRSNPVTIGTPLSAHATRVLLLGSGELGKEVAIELQRFGVEVIAADRYAQTGQGWWPFT